MVKPPNSKTIYAKYKGLQISSLLNNIKVSRT